VTERNGHKTAIWARIVDARQRTAFAARHIPGALSNPFRDAFATWLGWLTDPTEPLITMLDDSQDRNDLVPQALKIGYKKPYGEEVEGAREWCWRMADSRWWKDFDAVIAAALPAGSRVLDVGCGDGGLVDRLGDLGFDALGADPAARAHPRLVREPVEHVKGPGTFDAMIAVMALHHAELVAAASAVTRLLRPRGRLCIYDFDWSAYDDRAAAWLAFHDPSGIDNSVAGWRREHSSLHRGVAIKEAFGDGFVPLAGAGRPYLARMLSRPDLEAAEHALIDAQLLPALGFWLIAERADETSHMGG
jgi:SAM-dependent methyltransferase